MKKFLLFITVYCLTLPAFPQTDSCHLRIALLTCTPGEELYSVFGHSALRVTDSSNHQDLIFNYGNFDFDEPGFYAKFGRGSLLYFVSVDEFSDFVYAYQYEKRGIIEQELHLGCAEKGRLFTALRENAREENKYYKYDFLFDNCSTRLRDIISKNNGAPPGFKNILPSAPVTFRNLIHEYLDKGRQPWSKLGIDILLGSKIDVVVTNEQAMFLPDYLMKGFDSASVAGQSLVSSRSVILSSVAVLPASPLSPPAVFGAVFLITAILSFVPAIARSAFFRIFDFLLFFIIGLLGILLVLMWTGREDTVCRNNFNLLWALPTHAVVAFQIHKNRPWIKYYLLVTTLLCAALLVLFRWLPQQMNPGLIPVIALLLLRSLAHYKSKT